MYQNPELWFCFVCLSLKFSNSNAKSCWCRTKCSGTGMEISVCTRTGGTAELDSPVAQEAPGGRNCWAGKKGGVPLPVLRVCVGPES